VLLCWVATRSLLLASVPWSTGDAVVTAFSFSIGSKIRRPSISWRVHASSGNNKKSIPPAFTVIEEDEDKDNSVDFPEKQRSSSRRTTAPSSPDSFALENKNNDDDDDADDEQASRLRSRSVLRPMRRPIKKKMVGDEGASWMTRNSKFDSSSRQEPRHGNGGERRSRSSSRDNVGSSSRRRREGDVSISGSISSSGGSSNNNNNNKTFRQDFRGTRVFVDGLPPHATWQNLKDHFRDNVFSSSDSASHHTTNNNNNNNNNLVVFASISTDPVTGVSKGHGIVQFETTDLAVKAIALSSNVPFQEKYPPLVVRPDRQQRSVNRYYDDDEDDDEQQWDSNNSKTMPLRQNRRHRDESSPSSSFDGRSRRAHADWVCADDEESSSKLDEKDRQAVFDLLEARNDARRRRNYDISDDIRQELKQVYGVHLDDRLHTWWTSKDGKHVPQAIREIRGGDGRWSSSNKSPKQQQPWRQIPTTPESDALVNPDLVNALLQQRDGARLERDFATADALLQEARAAPKNKDLFLRIDDDSRTWRVWTPEPPPPPASQQKKPSKNVSSRSDDKDKNRQRQRIQSPSEQCIAIVQEHAPNRVGEIQLLLEKFVGREYQILKKLQSRYTPSESESESL
jgi:hypothetical protein